MSSKQTSASEKIDTFIANLPDFSKDICAEIRKIINANAENLEEDWKWNNPAWSGNSLVFFLGAFKKHVTLTFFQGALIEDRYQLFNQGKSNTRNRSIKYTDVSNIQRDKLTEYIREAAENDYREKAVEIQQDEDKTVVIPEYIQTVLDEEGLSEKYDNQIYTYRKGYVRWIEQAKRDDTKRRRIDQMVRELREGKEYMGMPR